MISRAALSLSVSIMALVSVLYAASAYAQTPQATCAPGEVLVSGVGGSVACAPGFVAGASGNVGIKIGNAMPEEALDVRRSIIFGDGTRDEPPNHASDLIGRGPISNFDLDVHGSTARVNYLWNATNGYNIAVHQNAGYYLVDNEPASDFMQTVNPSGNPGAFFAFYSSSGGAAGSPIDWYPIAHFSGAKNIWLSPRGEASDFIIRETGRVGIGAADPGYKLDVNGAENASAYLVNGVAVDFKRPIVPPVCVGLNLLQFNGTQYVCTPMPH